MFCIQESKLQEGQISLELEGYHQYWNYAIKKAIPERPSLPEESQCPWHTASVSKNMTRKAA